MLKSLFRRIFSPQRKGPDVNITKGETEDRYSKLKRDPCFNYLEKYLESLNPESEYLLQERLNSGQLITHHSTPGCKVFTNELLWHYCRAVFSAERPAYFIITPIN